MGGKLKSYKRYKVTNEEALTRLIIEAAFKAFPPVGEGVAAGDG